MYIKLGKTHINYNVQEIQNKYTIVGQIINSPTSYENPVLVNSSDELDIWFSKDFIDRDYFLELLGSDVTLYLYKPISEKSTNMKGDVEFVDYNDWDTLNINGGLVDETTISFFYLMKKVEKGGTYKYKVLNSDKTNFDYYIWKNNSWIMYFGNDIKSFSDDIYFDENDLDDIGKILSGDQFKIPTINDPSDFWIWLDDTFVVTSQLPQNLENFSESLNNRDTLTITNSELIPYTHPEFTKLDKIGVYSDTKVNLNTDKIDLSRINEGKDTLVFHLRNTYTQYSYNGMYFVIINPVSGESKLIYNASLSLIPQEIIDFCSERKQLSPNEMTVLDFVNELANEFEALGYTIENIENGEFKAYSSKPVKVTYFNNLPGLDYEPDIKTSYNIIAKSAIDNDNNVIEFWSKTIGGTEHDEDRISINIEKVEIEDDTTTDIDVDPYYRVTISKYGYTETFEAPTRPTEDRTEERLDYVISRKSRLVYCSIQKPGRRIKEGDYVLRGGRNEKKELEWNSECWRKAISILFNDQAEPVYPDFFLIPNITKYTTSVDINEKYYSYYKKLLDYATEFNCQFLIQNNDCSIDSYSCCLYYKSELTEEDVKRGCIQADTLLEAFHKYKEGRDMDDNVYYTIYSDTDNSAMYYINKKEITENELENDSESIRVSLLTYADNDYIFNYTKDTENRLVYFYRSLLVNGKYRPGYYVFIKGVLTDKYSISTSQAIYEDPIADFEDVYSNSVTKTLLEAYKSNYLINNNINYFYKSFQNGVNPKAVTTILFRFVAGKIQRELQKNRWEFLGEKNMSKIQQEIENILSKIQDTYKIVRSIVLTKFLPTELENKIDIEMDVKLDDLVEKDITLDITVDYSDLAN